MKNTSLIRENNKQLITVKKHKRNYNTITATDIISGYRLVNKFIKKGNITAADVNQVLKFAGVKITQSELDSVLVTPRLKFSNLDRDTIKSKEYLQNIGTYRGKIQVPGVYIWTHLDTGDKYVGSSSKLAKRLQGYFHGTHKSVGKFIPLLKLEGLSKFELEVLLLTESYFVNKELALEQYFLLHPEYNLNILKVVSSFSGARSKPLYMYNKDFSKLIFYSDTLEDFIFKLGTTPIPKIIVIRPVAENEPIPPLPNWKEISFDHKDYHIRNKREIKLRYSEMVNNSKLNIPSNRNQEWIETEALGIEELFSEDCSKLMEDKSSDLDKLFTEEKNVNENTNNMKLNKDLDQETVSKVEIKTNFWEMKSKNEKEKN